MIKYIKVALVFIAVLPVVACSTGPRQNPYTQPSPQIEARKSAGFERGALDRDSNSERYDMETTLESTTNQIADVHRSVLFTYRASRGNHTGPRLSHCSLHVKSSDRSTAEVYSCRLEHSGVCAEYIKVVFRGKTGERRSFDLTSHTGQGGYVGGGPACIANRWVVVRFPGGLMEQDLRYDSWGEDPNK